MLAALFLAFTASAQGDQTVLKKYRDAVVKIEITGRSLGTGFFISPDGELVTNFHVFKDAITGVGADPVFTLADGRRIKSYEIGRCTPQDKADLCILKLNVETSRWFRPQHEMPSEGARVFTIGHPQGRPWVIQSGKFLSRQHHESVSWVEVAIAFDGGISGSPIFTSSGQLLGIATQYVTSWYGYEPKQRYKNLETSLGISTREILALRKKVRNFVAPARYYSQN